MRQWTIDAFADRPFRGNPACVVEPFDAWPEASWMQALAQENNQAETAYLLKTADPARFGLRWFTPTKEMPLCGHATLASAHVLFTELGFQAETVAFDTQSGRLAVSRSEPGYVMDFPSDPPRRIAAPAGLAEALGAEPAEVWAGQYLVALFDDEAAVRALSPDLAALAGMGAEGTSLGNVVAAAPADSGAPYQVVDRFFAPGSGIPEDPATGSSHCILGPLFAARLGLDRVVFHQAYPGRGAMMSTEVRGDRVLISGEAVKVVESRLYL